MEHTKRTKEVSAGKRRAIRDGVHMQRYKTYVFSETVVIEVPLPELFVAFDCSSLIAASSGEEVLVEAASHKGLKIWKPPPVH
mgnify:CR=1 FL=1